MLLENEFYFLSSNDVVGMRKPFRLDENYLN